MFNYVIILNSAPFFILAEDEEQVLEIHRVYKDKVDRVIKGENLEVQAMKATFSLSNENILLIPEVVNEEKEKQLKLISEEEQDQMVDEISKDL